jgi:hypothetical protein
MNKRTMFTRKLVTLVVAALLTAQVAMPSTAVNLNPESSSPNGQTANVDLSSETRIFDSYSDPFGGYLRSIDDLKKKPSISKAQIAEVAATAENLKQRAAEFERNVESLIVKLKAAGLWPRLSDIVKEKLKDSRALGIINRNGGPNQWLEHAASVYTANAREFFDQTIAEIRSKHQARSDSPSIRPHPFRFNLTTVSYDPAAPRVAVSFVCLTGGVRTISKTLNGSGTRIDVEDIKQACGEK